MLYKLNILALVKRCYFYLCLHLFWFCNLYSFKTDATVQWKCICNWVLENVDVMSSYGLWFHEYLIRWVFEYNSAFSVSHGLSTQNYKTLNFRWMHELWSNDELDSSVECNGVASFYHQKKTKTRREWEKKEVNL